MSQHNYQFPVKAIVMILVQEQEGIISQVKNESPTFTHQDCMRELSYKHIQSIRALSSYEEIEGFLGEYYRMTLQEWIDSL